MTDKYNKCFDFKYSSQVEGKNYEGHNVIGFMKRIDKWCQGVSTTVEVFLEGHLSHGNIVTVHYAKYLPGHATLKPSVGLPFFIPLILSLAGIFFTLGIIVKGLVGK